MPALTFSDLSNAKVDIDFIGEVVLSSSSTAKDRMGNTKSTMAGAIATISSINPRGQWTSATSYSLKDVVQVNGVWYICVVDHQSTEVFNDDKDLVWRIHQGATKLDLQSLIYLGSLLTAFGDSFTAGITGDGIYSTENFANFISRETGLPIVNKAISGSLIIDLASNFYNTVSGPGDTFITMTGYNDGRVYGASPGGMFTYRGVLRAMLVWLALPEASKMLATSADVSYTGEWNVLVGVYANKSTSKYTVLAGSTARAKFKGNALYIGYTRSSSLEAVFNVNIDGRDYGNFKNSRYTPSNSGLVYGPDVLRIPGLQSAKPHMVVITHISGGEFYLDYIAGNGGSNAAVPGARVFSANTVRMIDYSHEMGSDLVVDKFNFIHSSVVAELVADGLNIMHVDVSSGYDVIENTGADGVHPNAAGERYLADTFLHAMSSASLPIDKGRNLQKYSSVPGLYTGNPSADVPLIAGEIRVIPFDDFVAPLGWVYELTGQRSYFPQTPGYIEMSLTLTFKGPLLAGRYYVEFFDQDNGTTYTVFDETISAQVDARTVHGTLTMYANGTGTRINVRCYSTVVSAVAKGIGLTRFAAKFLGQ